MIPTREQNPNGLHNRYRVTKADGSACDPRAVYFVLRLDNHAADHQHVEACREAALCYAENAPIHLAVMASELRKLIADLDNG